MNQSDVLVIGCGIAGALCALELAEAGKQVVVVSASCPMDSNSSLAQGGVAYKAPEDNKDILMQDVIKAGAGLCYPQAVEFLAERGPELVEELLVNKWGVPFDREDSGELCLTKEGAHSVSRIVHHKDRTGNAIMRTLLQRLEKMPNVDLKISSCAVDLITLSHHSKNITDIYKPSRCVGAYVLIDGEVLAFFAEETVLATGGLSEVFLHTSNPKLSRGDGIAMAYRAGARIMNLEYIQFHPTTLFAPVDERFLLSEALRGEGAELLDLDLQPFMHKYDSRKNLAPRDIVSRSIFQEMMQSQAEHLWLDISFRGKEFLQNRFPMIYNYCLQSGYDMSQQPLPVVPAAHYSCGGVAVDLTGKTTIQSLRAIGEVSCTGVHGANRLASTSLLEGVVWAKSCSDDILKELKKDFDPFPEIEDWSMSNEKIDRALIRQDWMTIKQTMWNYVGLVRDRNRLRRALKMLRELQWEVESFYEKAELTEELVGLRNGVLTALLITQGAFQNRNSRGCHYRLN